MTEIDYQKEILDNYNEDEGIKWCHRCNSELPKNTEGYFERGPEIAYVGEQYGRSGCPKILFTRLNPIKEKKTGGNFFFGSRKSLEEYLKQQSKADVKKLFQKYLDGWDSHTKKYIGLCGAGTITGHPNKSKLPDEDKQKHLRYGIQFIMNKMIEKKVFDKPKSSPLEFCAINNVIKCAGKKRASNPGGVMFKTCNFYRDGVCSSNCVNGLNGFTLRLSL